MHRHLLTKLALVAVAVCVGCQGSQPITTGALLADMTDLEGLTRRPRPPFTCRQFSSYDRAATSPADAETWFANADAGKFIRAEKYPDRTEYVMMEADGPGAIVRIWSANPRGNLRFYLDHADTPTLEVPMKLLLGGGFTGIPLPLAGARSSGWNLYFPIPYAQHCKVTGDEIVVEKDHVYYHINYRTYPPGTKVVTFKPVDLQTYAAEIVSAADELDATRGCRLNLAAGEPGRMGIELPPGGTLPWRSSREGPGAIEEFCVEVEAPDVPLALRQLMLTMVFDDEPTVVCPLGDFFGAGPGVNAYGSMPLGVTVDGVFWCRWVMPWRESAQWTIRNLGSQTVRVHAAVAEAEFDWTSRAMYFHAGWRVARQVPTRPFHDWNYVTIDGEGVFVGAAFSILNPTKTWWGEGDEKIYVDGEEFPSHFGTGTEDYYGYAWCNPTPFTHAYHNQPRCDGPDNYGRTAVNRWHILDRIPFRESFRFDMELWHWRELLVPEMSVVTYWYGRPGATANYLPLTLPDLELAQLPPYEPKRVAGALEGEELRIVSHTGTATPQTIDGCSNERHLWWRDAQPRDRLVLAFPAPAAGRYRVYARFVNSYDYGVHRLTINDAPAGPPQDLYKPQVTVTDEQLLGEFELRAGDNEFATVIVGANGNALKGYMFGLDYLRLEPVSD